MPESNTVKDLIESFRFALESEIDVKTIKEFLAVVKEICNRNYKAISPFCKAFLWAIDNRVEKAYIFMFKENEYKVLDTFLVWAIKNAYVEEFVKVFRELSKKDLKKTLEFCEEILDTAVKIKENVKRIIEKYKNV